jgi:hypothetical protein
MLSDSGVRQEGSDVASLLRRKALAILVEAFEASELQGLSAVTKRTHQAWHRIICKYIHA